MTTDQKHDFELRRNMLMEKHRQRDPALKKARRRSFVTLLTVPVYVAIALGVMLLGMKSMSIALKTPAGYVAMVDPVLIKAPAGSLRATLLAPDPVSTEIAAVLRPIIRLSAGASSEPAETAGATAETALPAPQPAQ